MLVTQEQALAFQAEDALTLFGAAAVAETKGARLRVYDPRRKTAARKRRR